MDEKEIKPEQIIINRWETSYYISQAILDDYAERMSKLTADSVETIKDRIKWKASSALHKSKITKKAQ